MSDMQADGAPAPTAARWPKVVGTLGIILGALIIFDKLDDVVVSMIWTEEDWSRMVGPEVARVVDQAMPPVPWLVLFGLVWTALAIVLIRGSIDLRRRLLSGVKLCKTWSRLALTVLALEMVWALWWLSSQGDWLSELAPGDWRGAAVFGVVVGFALMAAYPAFLLAWFARPPVRRDIAAWSG